MTNRVPALLSLILALPVAWAGDPTPQPPKKAALSDRSLTYRVDELLRTSGSKLMLDEDKPFGVARFKTDTNKVLYHTSNTDKRLVRIEIEPVGEETLGTTQLAGTFLAVLGAVDSVEDGMKYADLLTREIAKDGLTRSVTLANGIKLMKVKKGETAIQYVIAL